MFFMLGFINKHYEAAIILRLTYVADLEPQTANFKLHLKVLLHVFKS